MRWIFCVFLFASTLFAGKPTICLNMIVKNESSVIKDCLESVKPWIDTWIIVDTGSTDGTQDVIKKTLRDIPGKLYERPWVDFAQNRNEALQYAKGKADYILLIDADEILKEPPNYSRPILDLDCYAAYVKNPMSGSVYQRGFLLSTHVDWEWYGVLHEGLKSKKAKTRGVLIDLLLDANPKLGARTKDPDKYKKDAAVLEKALENEPNNSRYMYYLAQSYHCDGNLKKALETFQKRSTMGGEEEEVYHSLYLIGMLQQFLNEPLETIANSYCKAYAFRPTRAEPVFRLAQILNVNQNYTLGYAMVKLALTIPKPRDLFYVEDWIYDYAILAEQAHCAACLGKIDESREIYGILLAMKNLPDNIRELVQQNLKTIAEAISKK